MSDNWEKCHEKNTCLTCKSGYKEYHKIEDNQVVGVECEEELSYFK